MTTEVCRCDNHPQDFQALTGMLAHAAGDDAAEVGEPISCSNSDFGCSQDKLPSKEA